MSTPEGWYTLETFGLMAPVFRAVSATRHQATRVAVHIDFGSRLLALALSGTPINLDKLVDGGFGDDFAY